MGRFRYLPQPRTGLLCWIKVSFALCEDPASRPPGLTCLFTLSRVFVQESIYDEFQKKFLEHTKTLKVGDPFEADTFQGPQISQVQYDRIMGYIQSGKDDGADLLLGGERFGNEGYYIQPTVFGNVNKSMKIGHEEIFGPVVVLIKFKTEEEVLEAANDTEYGLASAVFTKDITRALNISHKLEAGEFGSRIERKDRRSHR